MAGKTMVPVGSTTGAIANGQQCGSEAEIEPATSPVKGVGVV